MSQPLRLIDIATCGAFPVVLIEIGRPELVVREPLLEHVIDNHEDRVGHGHHGLLVPTMAHDTPVAGSEPTVLDSNRGQCRFRQRGAQPPVALPRRAAGMLARALVEAWTEAGPTGDPT